MGTIQSEASAGQATDHPNAELIAGLREVADWLEEHPDAPAFRGFLHAYYYGASGEARGTMERFAVMLGDRACERADQYGQVHIEAEISGVKIQFTASLAALGGRKIESPPIEYEPILAREDEQS